MPDVDSALAGIASSRGADPLAPVTVIVPSHAAGLQLRRRLAERGPFAAVRFETLPRIAELIGAGHLAAEHRSPLARPIGDYIAEVVARQSRGVLARVAALPGYARVLRKLFRRLRRGGIERSADLTGQHGGRLDEVLRLYDHFRQLTAQFYDEEDLLHAAAAVVRSGRAGALADLGAIYVVPPAAQTAGSDSLLRALRAASPSYVELAEAAAEPAQTRFVLAPDPASEAREVVREVLSALESGLSLHEVAVFHGADPAYPRLLREAFDSAKVPAVPLPGVPLIETPAGRAVLALARLPETDFSRTATIDLLGAGPVKKWLPGRDGPVRAMTTAWDAVSRAAGITHGAGNWTRRLSALVSDREGSIAAYRDAGEEGRARRAEFERDEAGRLLGVIEALIEKLTPLSEVRPAAGFIAAFREVIETYLDPGAPELDRVDQEIEQLGTVDAVGGSFNLGAFAEAFAANLEAGSVRRKSLGEGIIIADYRAAAALRFRHVVLCGAYEGALPAGPGADALVEDRTWQRLRNDHPFIEDAALRLQRAGEAVARATAAVAGGTLVWTVPRYEPGGTREYYPSPLMAKSAEKYDPAITTASELRRRATAQPWLRRASSPLSAMLRRTMVDLPELKLRAAILLRRDGALPADHPLGRAVHMLRSRRGASFTEWDGNLSALSEDAWLELQSAVSPTSLEHYGACGYRYFCRSLLRLNVAEEPEEREMMNPAERGSLVHRVLERFFKEQRERGRPQPDEAWTEDDRGLLLTTLDEELTAAAERGLTGLDVYARHEARTLRGDLARFLDEDTLFRHETGAVPCDFEVPIPEVEIAGVRLRGVVDRIDRTPDGRRAWVIDYKTGSSSDFDAMETDPLAGGTKLQLPVYLAAVRDAEDPRSLYWFITQKGEFQPISYEPSATNQERFERTLQAIVGGIKAGAFPAVPRDENEYYGTFDNCKYCDFTRICSRRRDYEFDAKHSHPQFSPWLAVAAAAAGDDAP